MSKFMRRAVITIVLVVALLVSIYETDAPNKSTKEVKQDIALTSVLVAETEIEEQTMTEAATDPEEQTEEPTTELVEETAEPAIQATEAIEHPGETIESIDNTTEATESVAKSTETTETTEATTAEEPEPIEETEPTEWDGPILNRRVGTIQGPSGKETYYDLPMSGVVKIMRNLGYSEEEYPYTISEDGLKMLGPYIIVAANLDERPRGTILQTSLGMAIVCDTGSFAKSNPTQLDIAADWTKKDGR